MLRAPQTMRILSDFDGVWTDQAGEARAIQQALAREAAPLIGLTEDEAFDDFRSFYSATLADPANNGWWPRGYLTAFVDEDELLATGAVSHWLDRGEGDPDVLGDAPDRWRAGMARGGFDGVEDLANRSFGPAMREHLESGAHGLVPEARDVVDELRRMGHDLVVVSNSPTPKLAAMFAGIGVEECSGVRFVGDARKWWIEDSGPTMTVAGRTVHLDRPLYRKILLEEKPDLIIGDVASLDLAMGSALRAKGELSKDVRLLLRSGGSPPQWAREQSTHAEGQRLVDEIVPSIRALVDPT